MLSPAISIDAAASFEKCRAVHPGDKASAVYLARCAKLRGRELPLNWRGTTRFR